MTLAGRVAIVTGAAKGMGAKICPRAGARGQNMTGQSITVDGGRDV